MKKNLDLLDKAIQGTVVIGLYEIRKCGCIKILKSGKAHLLTYHLSMLLAYLFRKTDFANWNLYLIGAQAILERSMRIIHPYKCY